MKFQRAVAYAAVGSLSFAAGAWLVQRHTDADTRLYAQARLLDDIVRRVSTLYVDSLNGADLYQLAVDGLLENLGDPYAGFFAGDEYDQLTEAISGDYVGIGVRVELRDGWITIVAPLPGSPAEAAGLRVGDRIVRVDSVVTFDWTSEQSVAALRGPPGSVVHLDVRRPGVPEPLPFTLERAEIHENAVRHRELLTPDVGYVALGIVNEGSADELRTAIDTLIAGGAGKLIVDLRQNPGGLLNEANRIGDLFLDRGAEIVETRSRPGTRVEDFSAREPERWPGVPIVVLVDAYTASAAEILAGALQDYDRALIVGTPTFGKGVVQSVFPVGREAVVKFTTGRWYTPLGRSLQRVPSPEDSGLVTTPAGRTLRSGGGIMPDVTVETAASATVALARVFGANLQALNDVLASVALDRAGRDSTATGPEPADIGRVREALRSRGVRVSAGQWRTVRAMVTRRLRYLVLRYAGGTGAEASARLHDDPIVGRALDRLAGARRPADLFVAPD